MSDQDQASEVAVAYDFAEEDRLRAEAMRETIRGDMFAEEDEARNSAVKAMHARQSAGVSS